MDIKFEQKDPSFGLLTLKVEPVDYQNEVTNQIKEYAKTVQLKGFRKGKAPLGMVKKMVGKEVKFEAINKAASNALTQYIKDSEHEIIGMPLSYLDETLPPFNNEDFYFSFKLGITPEFDTNISDKVVVDEYEVEITDEMVNETIERMTKQFEDTNQVDVAEAGDYIAGKITEKDGDFEVDTLLPLKRVAESQLPLFVGLTKEDTVEFDLSEAFPDAKHRALALGIEEEAAEKLSQCHFAVTEITRTSTPKMDVEFFKKATGEDLETEEDFRNKVRELIHVPHKENSNMLLNYDIRTAVLGASNLKISEEFTKAWFDHLQRSADEKQPIKTSDYTSYVEQLHWEIITGKLAKEHDLKVSEDELKEEARKFAKKLFAQMGMGSVPEEQLESIAQMYLNDEQGAEQKAKLKKDVLTEKTFTLIKSQITLNQHVVSNDDYTAMMDKRNKEIEEKFNQTTEAAAVESVEEKSAE